MAAHLILPPACSPLPSLHVFGPYDAPNTLELFIDFVCPRSRALFCGSIMGPSRNVDDIAMAPGALAVISVNETRFKVVVRPFVQGVHLGSKVTHEVALAVLTVAPAHFWNFCIGVFGAQLTEENYFDKRVDGMTPNALRTELVGLFEGGLPSSLDTATVVPRVRVLASMKSNPGKKDLAEPQGPSAPDPDPTAGNLVICEALKQVVQKSYLNPASAPGVAFWNGVPIPEFSPNWGELEWSTFLMSRLA